MSKFFYFSLTYYAISKSEETKGFELISGSISISIYLLIWNFIFNNLITYLSENSLFVLQILFAVIICFLYFLVVCCIDLASILDGKSFLNFLLLHFIICCCGGLFLTSEEGKGKCCSLYCDKEANFHCLCCTCECCNCEC